MIYDAPDWAPPFGIVRPALPPDDAAQDAACAVAAAVAHARIDLGFDVAPVSRSAACGAGAVTSSADTPGSPLPGVSAQPRPVREQPAEAWTWCKDARL